MIEYIIGDATVPQATGKKIIFHVSNVRNGWGRGFVVEISKKWKEPERVFKASKHRLGSVDFIKVEPDIWVANMYAQFRIGKSPDGKPNVDLEALDQCLRRVNSFADQVCATVHGPRIACGLGGCQWTDIEPIINECITNCNVFIYDLPRRQKVG